MAKHYLSKHILEIVPTFCWVTAYDILLMVEDRYPDVDQNVLSVTICYLVKKGLIEKGGLVKVHHGRGVRPRLYKRAS